MSRPVFLNFFFSAATAHPPLVQFLSVLTLFYNSSKKKKTGFLTPANGKNESESTIFFIKGVFGYTAGSVGWFISLLVREEVLLAGLCEKKILFRLKIYDRLRQATAKRTG